MNGRHPLLPRGGAAVDEDLPPEVAATVAGGWARRARELLEPRGLGPVHLRVVGGHVTLAAESPPWLRLETAELLDLATGAEEPEVPRIRHDPAVAAFLDRVAATGRPWFADETGVTVGVGRRHTTWPWSALFADPEAATRELAEPVRRCPVVLVSGTNGKTTTALLLGAIAWADGWLPGVATSTGIRVGRELVEPGDWSGAEAARRILRHDRPNFAVLESARGGLLRRGLLVDHADVAVLTNTSADHLGEYGVETVQELARVKLLLAESLRSGGTVVIRAGDEGLEGALPEVLAARPDLVVHRFSVTGPADAWHPSAGIAADAWLDGDTLRLHGRLLARVADVPITLGGAALFNVENALAAALAACAAGIGDEAIAAGLRDFRPDPAHNPGRANVFEVRGATAILDYAHNPDGLARLRELADRSGARRRAMLLGQAGDRTDALLRSLAAAAAAIGCDRYVLKPLPGYARGRPPEEVVALLRAALLEEGVPEERIETVPDELAGVRALLAGAAPGDLLLVLVHEHAEAAARLLAEAG